MSKTNLNSIYVNIFILINKIYEMMKRDLGNLYSSKRVKHVDAKIDPFDVEWIILDLRAFDITSLFAIKCKRERIDLKVH